MLIDQKSAAKSKIFFVGFRVGRPGFLLGGVLLESTSDNVTVPVVTDSKC